MTRRKKPVRYSTAVRWTKEWCACASAEELLRALDQVTTSEDIPPIDQFEQSLMWEARFEMLEREIKRRMKLQSVS